MDTETQIKLIRQGSYIAEIDIALTYTDSDWSPYLRSKKPKNSTIYAKPFSKTIFKP